MPTGPLVSVIIPTYNSAPYVAAAVVSVLEQTYQPIEILVVDDGSTDHTAAVLEPYHSKIRYIHQENRGAAVARNSGIAAAQGELIAFLDADDLWLPEKLQQQVQYLEQRRTVGLIHTGAFFLHQESTKQFERSQVQYLCAGKCYEPLFLYGNRIIMSSVVLTRACLEQVGTFDTAITQPTVEDYDLWLRVARAWELAYLQEPLVLYRLHASNASKNTRLLRQYELYVLEKTLQADPTLPQRVAKQAFRYRFFDIWFELGYCSFKQEHFRDANRSFLRALQWRPSPYVLLLWLVTLCPGSAVQYLRHLKHRHRL